MMQQTVRLTDTPFTILIVDDIADNLFTLETLLLRLGQCTVVQAQSGEAALAATLEHPIDLILLDIQMPGMDGYETARHLKMRARTRDIPIIFLTAVFKSDEFVKRGYAVGAIDYLTKPLDDNQLLNRIALYRTLHTREVALKETLEKLRRSSEARFRAYFERSLVGMAIYSPEKGWLEVNDALCQMLGYPREAFLKLTWADLTHPEDIGSDLLRYKQLLSGEIDGYAVEKCFIRQDGRKIHARLALRGVLKEQGGVDYLAATVEDFTERKKSEEGLAFQAQRALALLELPRDAETLDELTFMQRGQEMAEELTGSRISFIHFVNDDEKTIELITWSRRTLEHYCHAVFDKHYPVSDAGIWADALRRKRPVIFNDYTAYPRKHGLPDGHAELNRLISIPVIENGKVVMLTGVGNKATDYDDRDVETVQLIANDIWRIVQRKRAEMALRESEERFRTMFNEAPLGIALIDSLTGQIYEVNPMFAKIAGRTLEQMTNIDWMSITHPDDVQEDLDNMALLNAGKIAGFQMEKRYLHLDSTAVWINMTIAPLKVEDKTRPRHLCMIEDITERKQSEQELKRSNAELEQFSYAISHDMRQPLRMISSYLQLLEKSLAGQLDGDKQEYFHFAIDGARRLDQMLLALLEYSRVGRKGEPPEWVESRELLDEALLFLQPAIAEAQAEVKIFGDWPRVFVRSDEMMRLLQNLIGNAVKYCVTGRRPEIAISSETTGNEWCLSIADNGVGILPDQMHRLFQVFQRLQTRAAFEGTGVGLALCRKIVEHHGGRIGVDSQGEGQGSTFWVKLPSMAPDA